MRHPAHKRTPCQARIGKGGRECGCMTGVDTRIRITMPVAQAARLWRELGQVLSNDEVAE